MKKLLLALPLTALLTACGSDSVEDIAKNYCKAVTSMNWKEAEQYAYADPIRNRENMHKQDMGKYAQVFMNQNCTPTKVEGAEDSGSRTVYFGDSKLDHVALQWDTEQEKFLVMYDGFKADLKLY
ncbi:hypothetical protein BEL05_00690 [Shewanella colwelliana]|uniref:Lipoprotein n=1 Tax=Shewanella colwelliana TaxID=23 RepID=A0A1E5IUB5_SHECO|nr:hypothetical protein [Shewanella colwelliana]OEG74149.1 hypothetical protein BEL05_00690 [Shewanella colwelliana]